MQISYYRIAWRDLQTNRTGAGDYVFSYKVASEISNDLNRITCCAKVKYPLSGGT
jgi:hypothetical protein